MLSREDFARMHLRIRNGDCQIVAYDPMSMASVLATNESVAAITWKVVDGELKGDFVSDILKSHEIDMAMAEYMSEVAKYVNA